MGKSVALSGNVSVNLSTSLALSGNVRLNCV
jgi:hypothetical protein